MEKKIFYLFKPLMTEREKAIALLTGSFDGNPAVQFSIGNHKGYSFRKKQLAAFMYDYCKARKGVHLSSNGLGIMLYYHSDAPISLFHEVYLELKLVLFALGIKRAWRVWKRQQKVRQFHKAAQPFIHCWYIGALSEGRQFDAARELRNKLYQESDSCKRPVLAETTMLQNKNVYERMGFFTYASVHVDGLETFLLQRLPN
jgi:hypothetical protein